MIFLISAMLLNQSGYASSPIECIEVALKYVNINDTDIFIDIGCGDGRVVIIAAKIYNCISIGIEKDKNLVEKARIGVIKNGVEKNVKILYGDALKFDIKPATIVYLYHQEKFLNTLKPLLLTLKSGTKIICLDYLPSWVNMEPTIIIETEDGDTHEVYIWEVK